MMFSLPDIKLENKKGTPEGWCNIKIFHMYFYKKIDITPLIIFSCHFNITYSILRVLNFNMILFFRK